jgi:hypothetical protein
MNQTEHIFGVSVNLINIVINSFSAFGTIGAVVVALWLAFRNERSRISIECQSIFSRTFEKDTVIINCSGIKLYIKNIGLRTVAIDLIEWRSGLFSMWPFVKRGAAGIMAYKSTARYGLWNIEIFCSLYNDNVITIDPGKIYIFENSGEGREWCDTLYDVMVQRSALRLKTLKLFVRTIEGKSFRCKLPYELMFQLRAVHKKKMEKSSVSFFGGEG